MIKTLGAYIKEFKRASIATPCYMILEVLMEMMIPYLMASIIDDGVNKGDMKHICLVGAGMLVIAAIGLFAGIMGGVYGAKASAGFARNLRKGMYDNIQTFSFSNIDKFSTASLVTRLTTDVTNIQNAYQMVLRMCMRAPASLICALAMAFITNARVSTIFLGAIVVLGIALFFIVNRARKYFTAAFPKYDELNASVQENVSAIRVVKAYVREDYEKNKFVKASENIYKIFVKAEGVVALNSPVMMFAVYGCILAISWIGAKMIIGTGSVALTTGKLMSLLNYCMSILMSLMMLSMVFVMLTMSIASAERICEVLNEKSDITNPENADKTVPDGSITFDHVTFRYSKTSAKPVLSDIDLSIKSGETIGIIGGTGSAKSTLVQLIPRLYDVTKGNVQVGGVDVRNYNLEVLRDQVSMVLQKNVLFSGSIYDNIRWGDEHASDEEVQRVCKLAQADGFVQEFPNGYNTKIVQGGNNVSGGQKQRLCIARALLKKPKILILDDSTSAVDTKTDALIRKAFREEIPNTTKIIIAQRVSSIEDADQIIVLDGGQIMGIGTSEELLKTNEIYREVYESQVKGGGDHE